MAKINAARGSYFETHKDKKEFWFITQASGTLKAFTTENGAQNEADMIKRNMKEDVSIDHVTRDEYNAWLESGAADGEGAGNPPNDDPTLTAEQQLANAQAAYDKAMAGGDATEITNTKKALSTAKARVTREANKAK